MADSHINFNMSEHWLSVGVKVSDITLYLFTNSDKPDINAIVKI